jgi:hypothetical protein
LDLSRLARLQGPRFFGLHSAASISATTTSIDHNRSEARRFWPRGPLGMLAPIGALRYGSLMMIAPESEVIE